MNVEFFLLKTVSTKMPPDFRPRDGMAQPEPLCGAHGGRSKARAAHVRCIPRARSPGLRAPLGSRWRGPATGEGAPLLGPLLGSLGRLSSSHNTAFAKALPPRNPFLRLQSPEAGVNTPALHGQVVKEAVMLRVPAEAELGAPWIQDPRTCTEVAGLHCGMCSAPP